MSDHEATAKRLLPCCNKSLGSCMFDNQHFPSCPAYYRPAVAAALAAHEVKGLERAKEIIHLCRTTEHYALLEESGVLDVSNAIQDEIDKAGKP